MKVSTNWLKEYVDVNITPEELANKMLFVGNEYEDIKKMCSATNLVVGHVLEKTPHPDSDHLNVCKVDLKDNIYQIVCGAPNVEVNQKVIVARVGAKLPNIEIKKAVIRNIESNGMICSLEELGIESKYISEKNGIYVLDNNAKVGDDPLKYLNLDDTIISYELTADRGDLLSIIGMAYETAAILNKKVKLPVIKINEVSEKNNEIIETKTEDCKIYLSRIVRDVVIEESPNFIKSRLIASGIRPINNVVDISNYVMLEYGQPLHFFDHDLLGNNIIVRNASKNELVTTLDNIERTLSTEDIVIANNKEIVAIAGVMGNKTTEVTNNTKNILIESAIFNPISIRNTSKKILRSEASLRFEKGIDPNGCEIALNRAAYLLQTYAKGKVLKGIKGFDNVEKNEKLISINTDKINKVLGMKVSTKDIEDIFLRLGFKYKKDKDNFKVYAPTRRLDINIKEDLIEEVGRIHGYDNMKGTLLLSNIKAGSYSKKYTYTKNIKERLQSLGLNEIITYSLVSDKEINLFTNDKFDKLKLLSPLSEERSILRYSLIPSLLKTIDYNLSRNIKDIKLYEIGKSYYKDNNEYKEELKLSIGITGEYLLNNWQGKKITSDFFVLKGIIENLFNYLGINKYKFSNNNIPKEYHPGKSAEVIINNISIGYIGCVHPSISKTPIYVCELNIEKMLEFNIKIIKYKEVLKYPSIIKDAAFILDKDINAEEVIKLINTSSNMVTNTDIFDLYEGSNIDTNKKSLAFKITFSSNLKTLTDEEVTIEFNNIIKLVEKEFKGELRNK